MAETMEDEAKGEGEGIPQPKGELILDVAAIAA
jgi:hypothetical protein